MNTTPKTATAGIEQPSPEFLHAANEYGRYIEAGMGETPTARAAFCRMLEHAPASLKRMLGEKARSLGLLPKAAGCLEDGTPVYAVDDIAAHLGISADEVKSSLGPTVAETTALSTIHTIQ